MTSNFEDFYKSKNDDKKDSPEIESTEKIEEPLTPNGNPKVSKVINFDDFMNK